jgi:hypothetical protein
MAHAPTHLFFTYLAELPTCDGLPPGREITLLAGPETRAASVGKNDVSGDKLHGWLAKSDLRASR